MAYGSIEGVANYAIRYTDNGLWTNDTIPTDVAVVKWLDQISAQMDTALAQAGFTVPVTNASAVKNITMIVEQLVADMARGANGTGRFFSDRAQMYGVAQWHVISNDILTWVKLNAGGLEAAGASRGDSDAVDIAYRELDASGDEVTPMFQREGFGKTWTDWDNNS